ncbi:MAG: hypothetical protein WBM83_02825, partial [Flavobacteriaceae bacterium]
LQFNAANDSVAWMDMDAGKILIQQSNPLKVLLVYEDSLIAQAKYLGAAFKAIATFRQLEMELTTKLVTETLAVSHVDVLGWLSPKTAPEFSGPMLRYAPDSLSMSLFRKGPKPSMLQLTRKLNTENLVEEHVAEELLHFLKLHPEVRKKVASHDTRTVAVNTLSPKSTGVQVKGVRAQLFDVSPWLWGLLVLVMLIERILAKLRKQ